MKAWRSSSATSRSPTPTCSCEEMPDAAYVVFDELRVELCVGQSLDLAGTASASTEADLANRIAVYKSGKYTVERPLHLGRRVGRRAPTARALALGDRTSARACAQLRDDVLGASAMRTSRGSLSATICARASPRRSSHWHPASRRPRPGRCWDASATPTCPPTTSSRCRASSYAPARLEQIESDIQRLVAEARDALPSAPLADAAATGSTSWPPMSCGGTDSGRCGHPPRSNRHARR